MNKKILLLGLIGIIFLSACSTNDNIERTQCLPEGFDYSENGMDDFGREIITDMGSIMPQYEWSYKTDKNCVTVIGRIY